MPSRPLNFLRQQKHQGFDDRRLGFGEILSTTKGWCALGDGGRVNVLGTATSSQEALSRVRDLEPEVVLVDVAMDDSLDTVRAIGEGETESEGRRARRTRHGSGCDRLRGGWRLRLSPTRRNSR